MPTTTKTKVPNEAARSRFQDAVLGSDVATVHAMLGDGFPVDTLLPCKVTALLLAVEKTNRTLVDILLCSGADVNWTSQQDETPLLAAVDNEAPDLVKQLLDAGANPDGGPRKAPLWAAVGRGDMESTDLLMEAGADLELKNKYGTTLLHRAVERASFELTQRMLQIFSADIRDFGGETPLFYVDDSSTQGEIVKLLVQHNADPNAIDKEGESALFKAVRMNRIKAFDWMIDVGADPRVHDRHGRSLFDVALEEKHDAIAVQVLNRAPYLMPVGVDLDRAFVMAVRGDCRELVQWLAQMGADLAQKPGGRTMLQIAPKNCDQMRQLLLALKASAAVTEAIPSMHTSVPAPTRSQSHNLSL